MHLGSVVLWWGHMLRSPTTLKSTGCFCLVEYNQTDIKLQRNIWTSGRNTWSSIVPHRRWNELLRSHECQRFTGGEVVPRHRDNREVQDSITQHYDEFSPPSSSSSLQSRTQLGTHTIPLIRYATVVPVFLEAAVYRRIRLVHNFRGCVHSYVCVHN